MPSLTNEMISRLFAAVDRTGATAAVHLNTEFHVNVLLPEPSWITWRMYVPTLKFVGAATVLFPPSVTYAIWPADAFHVIVAPSAKVCDKIFALAVFIVPDDIVRFEDTVKLDDIIKFPLKT